MGEINFRELQEKDVAEIYNVAKESWKFTYELVFKEEFINFYLNKYYSKEALLFCIQKVKLQEQFFYIAEDDLKIVGYCNVIFNGNEMELARMYLLPDYIGREIGKKLLELSERYIKLKGFKKYICYVNKFNKIGQKFYTKYGFKRLPVKDKTDIENNDYQWCMEKIIES